MRPYTWQEMYTDSSSMSRTFSAREEECRLLNSSWLAISSIGGTTRSRRLLCYFVLKCSIPPASTSSEVTTRAETSPWCMVFSTRSTKSTEIPTVGSTFTKLLTSCLLELLSMEIPYAFTVDYHRICQLSTRCVFWTENRKFLTRVLWLTWCGLTLRTLRLGEGIREELDGYSGLRWLTSSICWTRWIW